MRAAVAAGGGRSHRHRHPPPPPPPPRPPPPRPDLLGAAPGSDGKASSSDGRHCWQACRLPPSPLPPLARRRHALTLAVALAAVALAAPIRATAAALAAATRPATAAPGRRLCARQPFPPRRPPVRADRLAAESSRHPSGGPCPSPRRRRRRRRRRLRGRRQSRRPPAAMAAAMALPALSGLLPQTRAGPALPPRRCHAPPRRPADRSCGMSRSNSSPSLSSRSIPVILPGALWLEDGDERIEPLAEHRVARLLLELLELGNGPWVGALPL